MSIDNNNLKQIREVVGQEIRKELGNQEKKFDSKLDKLEQRIDGKFDNQEKKFDSKLDKLEQRLGVKLTEELDNQEQKFEVKLTEFKSEFFEKIDPILEEVKTARDERPLIINRIEKLEKILMEDKAKDYEANLKPLCVEDFNEMIDKNGLPIPQEPIHGQRHILHQGPVFLLGLPQSTGPQVDHFFQIVGIDDAAIILFVLLAQQFVDTLDETADILRIRG